MIPFSADFEKKVLDLGPEEGAKFCAEVGVKSAFPRIIKSGYHAINLSHYFTVRRQRAVFASAPPAPTSAPPLPSCVAGGQGRGARVDHQGRQPCAQGGGCHSHGGSPLVRRSARLCLL